MTDQHRPEATASADLLESEAALRERVRTLERHLRKRDEQRRAMLHIMTDLNEFNKRLGNQRKAMLHILGDYERARSRLARQTDGLDNSRRALLHILQDSHQSNLRLESSRKAMIHIMGDLRETTAEMQRREQELRDKQEQLVQAGKPAPPRQLTPRGGPPPHQPPHKNRLFLGQSRPIVSPAGAGGGPSVPRPGPP